MKKGFLLILAGLMLALAAGPALAADAKAEGKSMIAEASKRGTLKVGFSTFVPWAMQDKDGNYIGFEIDVARRFAEDHGMKPEFVPVKWAGIIPALLTGQFDLIIGSMSATPERNLKVNFSIPYDYSGMDLVASKAKAAGFSSLEDFNKPDVIITIRSGGSAKAAVEKHIPKATIRAFDEEAQALQEVVSGRAHAFASSVPGPALSVSRNPDVLFRPLKDTFSKESVCVAVRKGDLDSLNVLDTWIRKVELEGWLQERRHYWFETTEWEARLK